MKARQFSERSIPLLFLIVTVAAYGLLLPLTGFYWDDWPFAWMAKFLGPWEFIPAFSKVRPFLGPIFFVTTSLIPPLPLYWQITALVIRFFSGMAAWFALRQVWPRHRSQTLIAALLFLVFPGYSQHWVAFTHINQEWIPFIFYLLSFGFTARAVRGQLARRRPGVFSGSETGGRVEARGLRQSPHPGESRLDTIYALLLLVAGVFPTEYFVSIEPLRFLFVWVIVSEQIRGFQRRFIESFRRWLPYFFIWLANGIWLAYFYTVGGYESLYSVEVVGEPVTVMRMATTVVEAIWKAGVYVWVQVFVLSSRALAAPATLASLGLTAVTFVIILLWLRRSLSAGIQDRSYAFAALFIGLAGMLLGRIPSFAAGLPLTLQSSFDRLMISMMLGASLFVSGTVELLIRSPRLKMPVFALLIALGIGQQFFNANIFRRDWAKQQDIYWQLAWRIPAMKPGTALLTDQLPIDYETDLSFTAPINWMYAPDYAGGDLPFALFYTEKRLGGAALPSLREGTPITLPIRRVSFQGSTARALVIYMPPNGCLRVLDPGRGDQITYGRQSRFLLEAIPLSDPSNIIVDAKPGDELPFLSKPEHAWCYYYARAELAYQQGDLSQVVSLIDEASALGHQPEDPFEWLAYIEAQALLGNLDPARAISMDAFEQDHTIRKGLCEVWKRVQAAGAAPGETETLIRGTLSTFECAQ